MTLGEKIKEARKHAGLTQGDLSVFSGVSKSTIREYEFDNVEPAFFKLCCIAKILNLSLDYLAGYSQDKYLK